MLQGLHKNPLVSSRARRECTNYWFHTAICCTNPCCSVICLLFTGEHDYRVFSKLRNPHYLFNDGLGFCGNWTVCCNGEAQDATSQTEKFRGFPQNLWVNTGCYCSTDHDLCLPTHHSWLHSHHNQLSVISISTMKQGMLAFSPSGNNGKAQFNSDCARISCNISFIIVNIFTGLHAHLLRMKIHYYQDSHITDTTQPPNKDILILFRQIHIQQNTATWITEDYAMCRKVVWWLIPNNGEAFCILLHGRIMSIYPDRPKISQELYIIMKPALFFLSLHRHLEDSLIITPTKALVYHLLI